MRQEELNKILKEHKLWLADSSQGKKADLRAADLCDVDLCYVDLYGADLRRADLRRADLCDANLHGACLREVSIFLGNRTVKIHS